MTKSTDEDAREHYGRTRRIVTLILSAIAGALLGSQFLAPFSQGPGDPGGHSIGAGLGGFVGLGIGVLLRIQLPRRDGQ